MPPNLTSHFDDTSLTALKVVFDEVWSVVESETPADQHEQIQDVIATAILHVAISGERDHDKLVAYAGHKAREALGSRRANRLD